MAGTSSTQHQCNVCLAKAAGRGGVIFRCWKCPVSFCGDCLPDEFEPLDVRSGEVIDKVKYLPSSVEYLICSGCSNGTTRKISRGMASLAAGGGGKGKKRSASETKPISQPPRKRAKKEAAPKTSAKKAPMESEYARTYAPRTNGSTNGREVEIQQAMRSFNQNSEQMAELASEWESKSPSKKPSSKHPSPAKARASPVFAANMTPPSNANGKAAVTQQAEAEADVVMVDSDLNDESALDSVAPVKPEMLDNHIAPVAEVEEGASSSRETPIRPAATDASPQKEPANVAVKLAAEAAEALAEPVLAFQGEALV